jgi:hypothetical protein
MKHTNGHGTVFHDATALGVRKTENIEGLFLTMSFLLHRLRIFEQKGNG